jgi:hypothetical protein
MAEQNTPFKEAQSIITIGSMLTAVVAYVGATHEVPIIEQVTLWLGSVVEQTFPFLPNLPNIPHIDALIGAVTIGLFCYVFCMPLATLAAKHMATAQLQNVEKQTDDLKRSRAKIARKQRNKDDFIVR